MSAFSPRRAVAVVGIALLGLCIAGGAALASATAPAVTSLSFVSALVGFVRVDPPVGHGPGQVYATKDGGALWYKAGLPVHATLLAMGSASAGVALVPLGVGMCGAQWTAVTTRDGAYTWHQPTTVITSDGPDALAYAAGRPLLLNGSCAGPYATLLTPGGASSTWRTLATFALTKAQAERYFSPSAVSLTLHGRTGFAAVAYLGDSASVAPWLVGYATTNGADTWHAVALGSRGLEGTVRGLSFANARDGIAATQNHTGTVVSLYATTDAGAHWTRAATVSGAVSTQLDLATAKVGYAALVTQGSRAVGRLLKTADGGRTWRTIALP